MLEKESTGQRSYCKVNESAIRMFAVWLRFLSLLFLKIIWLILVIMHKWFKITLLVSIWIRLCLLRQLIDDNSWGCLVYGHKEIGIYWIVFLRFHPMRMVLNPYSTLIFGCTMIAKSTFELICPLGFVLSLFSFENRLIIL